MLRRSLIRRTMQQDLIDAINAPIHGATGRPLIGNGANGARGPGQTAGPGGWLIGNGGAGGSGARRPARRRQRRGRRAVGHRRRRR